jgi:glutamyl-Q tRNA(Asp) synthetase
VTLGAGLVTRFAPSPTGPLHLGHAFSALAAGDLARASGGTFLLRIEDLDRARSRPAFEAAIRDDLAWLGLAWPEPVLRQSGRGPAYAAALDRLRTLGVLYPCACTRAEIRAALAAPQEGAEGTVYPGTCRGRSDAPTGAAWRLDLRSAFALTGPLDFVEAGTDRPGRHAVTEAAVAAALGDVVLARRDLGAAYHLAVVVDDGAQGVTDVVRGVDLFAATGVHRLLQALLGLPTPTYRHHRLIRDDAGRRLAKRDDARALARYRAEGATPDDVRRLLGLANLRTISG